MGIIRYIGMLIFGICSIITGLVSIIAAISFMRTSVGGNSDTTSRLVLMIFEFIIGEMLLAFGVVAILAGVRCVVGLRGWMIKTNDFMWKRAVRYGLALGGIAIAAGILLALVKHFST